MRFFDQGQGNFWAINAMAVEIRGDVPDKMETEKGAGGNQEKISSRASFMASGGPSLSKMAKGLVAAARSSNWVS